MYSKYLSEDLEEQYSLVLSSLPRGRLQAKGGGQ